MCSQVDTLFAASLQKLPGELSSALKRAGLDDACTLANCPRAELKDLQERGIGVDPVAETHGSTGDLDIAVNYDVSMGGGTAVMDISVGSLSSSFLITYLHLLTLSLPHSPRTVLAPSPYQVPFCSCIVVSLCTGWCKQPNVGRKRTKKAAKAESMIPGVVSEVGVAVETKLHEENPGEKVSLTKL